MSLETRAPEVASSRTCADLCEMTSTSRNDVRAAVISSAIPSPRLTSEGSGSRERNGKTAIEGRSVTQFVGPAYRISEFEEHAVSADRAGEIAQRLRAEIDHGALWLWKLFVHRVGDEDLARLCYLLQPRGNIHLIAVDVVRIEQHVAKADADPDENGAVTTARAFLRLQRALDVDSAPDRIGIAWENGEEAVTSPFDRITRRPVEGRADEVVAQSLQALERFLLGAFHQTGVSRNIR